MKTKVFIDIDGTITDGAPEGETGYFEHALQAELVRRHKLSRQAAMDMLLAAEEKASGKDPFYALQYLPLKVSKAALWRETLKRQRRKVFPYPDAVWLVKALRRKGFDLYLLTNNTANRALSKMVRAGLATTRGSRYFKGIYGADVTGCRKNSPAFYRRVFKLGKFNPKQAVMIGDDPFCDQEIPCKLGVKNVILVNRRQKERVVKKGSVFRVNSLRFGWKIVEEILRW
ncbi:MAG: HAD family hydrolase [Verrucomicrobiae bacterium]|nr:HAD family hydrolase [Verrucomicrobiae bacterium]